MKKTYLNLFHIFFESYALLLLIEIIILSVVNFYFWYDISLFNIIIYSFIWNTSFFILLFSLMKIQETYLKKKK